MGRLKAPYADVSSLTLALKLIALLHNAPSRDSVSEKQYFLIIGEILERYGIVKQMSINQILKLLGKPYQKDLIEADGIDMSVLNQLAKSLLDSLIGEKLKTLPKTQGYWDYFVKEVVRPPLEMQAFNEKRYYKYLSEKEKNSIDNFVHLRISELSVDKDIHNYIVYFWGNNELGVCVALLQINERTSEVNYNYFTQTAHGWTPRVSFQYSADRKDKGEFLITQNLCVLHLIEPDTERFYKRMTIYIQLNKDFFTSKMFKGELLIFASETDTPAACEVVIEKRSSYLDAMQIIKKEKIIEPQICLELTKRRVSASAVRYNPLQGLKDIQYRSEKTYERVRFIAGEYYFGYIAGSRSERRGSLVIGHAVFNSNGNVSLYVAHQPEIKNYVDNVHYLGKDLIRILPMHEDHESLSFLCNLKIHSTTNDFGEERLDFLDGSALGLRESNILASDIVFFKFDKKFETIRDRIPLRFIKLTDPDLSSNQYYSKLRSYFEKLTKSKSNSNQDDVT